MMSIFKYFKLKKKQKIEKELNKFILFNEWRIECYKKYPNKIEPPIKEFLDYTGCLAMGFDKSLWKDFIKYNVNKELFNKQIRTCNIALNANDKLEKRIKKEKSEKKEREQINLYKKAILELRKERKI